MSKNIYNFCIKSINLFKHFFWIYSKPALKINNIDKVKSIIRYENISNGVISSKHVQSCFENKAFLSNFNGTDAAYIGYAYGVWLQSSNY